MSESLLIFSLRVIRELIQLSTLENKRLMSPTKVGPEQHTNAAAADVAPDSQFSTQISGLLLSVRETLRLCQFDEIIEDNLCMLLLNLEEFCLVSSFHNRHGERLTTSTRLMLRMASRSIQGHQKA
jgi:hypothetical protein